MTTYNEELTSLFFFPFVLNKYGNYYIAFKTLFGELPI